MYVVLNSMAHDVSGHDMFKQFTADAAKSYKAVVGCQDLLAFFKSRRYIGVLRVARHYTWSVGSVKDFSEWRSYGCGQFFACITWVKSLQELPHSWLSEVNVLDIRVEVRCTVEVSEGISSVNTDLNCEFSISALPTPLFTRSPVTCYFKAEIFIFSVLFGFMNNQNDLVGVLVPSWGRMTVAMWKTPLDPRWGFTNLGPFSISYLEVQVTWNFSSKSLDRFLSSLQVTWKPSHLPKSHVTSVADLEIS